MHDVPDASLRDVRTADTLEDVVTTGLCIGCGLCEAVGPGRVRMALTDKGSLRPAGLDRLEAAERALLMSACPGRQVAPRRPAPEDASLTPDPVWGTYHRMVEAWAGDPDIRFEAATGGALTALGVHLVNSGAVDFVLQVKADADNPMRSHWVMSEDIAAVRAATGSRYGPVAPLAGFMAALDRGRPFALIAKPCDLGAVHNLSRSDPRVDALCRYRLTMVCGGQSRLSKSEALLAEFGLEEDELTLFRYRGYGNPGRTRIETADGRFFEKTYNELWEDESGWELESRCKLCPDALGEAADIAAADIWPGGGPSGEDEGFNGIVVRTRAGMDLVDGAVAAGALTLGDSISVVAFNDFQPHQVRKKQSLRARYQGLADAGYPALAAMDLRIDELDAQLDADARMGQVEGARSRALEGRFREDIPDIE